VATYTAVQHSEAFERQLGRMQVALTAQGRAGELSRDQLSGLVREVGLLPTVSGSAAQQIVASYTQMRSIGGGQIADLSRITADFATATGQQLPAAAATLAKAFADPEKGARELDAQLNILSASQLIAIQNFTANGQQLEAQKVLYEALRDRVSGLTTQAMTPLEQSTDRLSHAWPTLMQKMGDSGAINLVACRLREDHQRRVVAH
jgi:phage-related minor tail protein